MLFVSTGQVAFPFLGLGTWCLDGSTLVGIPTPKFGTAVRQPTATPAGVQRSVTNCVETTF